MEMIVFVLRLQSVTERKKRENGRKRRAQVVGFNTLNNFCLCGFFFLLFYSREFSSLVRAHFRASAIELS